MVASGVWGKCLKIDPTTLRTDDCQQFEPTPGKERFCECCEHHRSHHQAPEDTAFAANQRLNTPVKEAGGSVQSGIPVRSSPRLAAKRLSLGGADSPDPKRKKDELAAEEPAVGSERALKGKVKIEPGVEAGPDPPKALLDSWKKLVKELPMEENGEYKLFCNKDGVWMVLCELCKEKKPQGYDTGTHNSLSNFKKQHFKTKYHGSQLAQWKDGRTKAEKKLEEQRAKREALVALYANRG